MTEDELHCSGGMGLKFAVVGMKMRNIAKNVCMSRLAKGDEDWIHKCRLIFFIHGCFCTNFGRSHLVL